MAVETYQQQLERVQAAIAKIESEVAQSWQQGQRQERRPELEQLYKREKYLRKMVARQSRGGLRIGQVVPRG